MSGIIGGAGSKSGIIGETELDYEEGTWTPSLSFAGGSGWSNGTLHHATYTKIGRTVTCQFDADFSKGSGTGQPTWSGVPFSFPSGVNVQTSIAIHVGGKANSTPVLQGYPSTTTLKGIFHTHSDEASLDNMDANDLGAGFNLCCTFTYSI